MKKLVVLTGAGMSAESGISTFRDSNGLWEKYSIEEVATPEAFSKNPRLVLDFYNTRRREAIKAKPNAGHTGLVELEKYFNVKIITQNVDNLHERAGSTDVLHLHGELMKYSSVKNPDKAYPLNLENPDIALSETAPDGSLKRPFIVWFGEAVPKMEEAVDYVQHADILIIIGTSLNVYPAAGLLNYFDKGKPVFIIDPQEVNAHRSDIEHIKKGASEGVKILAGKLKTLI